MVLCPVSLDHLRGLFELDITNNSINQFTLPNSVLGINKVGNFGNDGIILSFNSSITGSDLKLLKNGSLTEINEPTPYQGSTYEEGFSSIGDTTILTYYHYTNQIGKLYKYSSAGMQDITPTGNFTYITKLANYSSQIAWFKMARTLPDNSTAFDLYQYKNFGFSKITSGLPSANSLLGIGLIKQSSDYLFIEVIAESFGKKQYWVYPNVISESSPATEKVWNQIDFMGSYNTARFLSYNGYGSETKAKVFHLSAAGQPQDITPAGSWTGFFFLGTNNSVDYYTGTDLNGKRYLFSSYDQNFTLITTTGDMTYAFKKQNHLFLADYNSNTSILENLYKLNSSNNQPMYITSIPSGFDYFESFNEHGLIMKSYSPPSEYYQLKEVQTIVGMGNNISLSNTSYSLSNVTATSGLTIEWTSSNNNIAKIENNAIVPLIPGVVTITALQAGNFDYTSVQKQTVVEVLALSQSITGVPAMANLTVGGSAYSLATITATSGLSVQFSSSNNEIATIENNQIVALAAGVVTITATQNGNALYQSAAAHIIVNVSAKISQVLVNIPSNSILTLSGNSLSLSAITATSGLAVTLESSDPTVISVENGSLKTLSNGVVTITAYQVGNSVYEASPKYTWVLSVVSPVLSSASTFENVAISIYPNPASDFIQISGAKEGSEYRFLTLDGKTALYGSFLQGSETRIDITQLKPGVYLFVYKNKDTHTNTLFVKE